jgi:manganese/zinc/iron transport system permease protein
MEIIIKKFHVKEDNALCCVLSFSFGLALLFISYLQTKNPLAYRETLFFLYGQVATLTDSSILPYAVLTVFTLAFVIFLYFPLKVLSFDQNFAKLQSFSYRIIQFSFFIVLVIVLTFTIKSVGVLLVTGLLLSPAIAARQYADRLSKILTLSALISVISTFVGIILSEKFEEVYQISFPPGPFIVCLVSLFAVFSLLFSPKRGVLIRLWRIWLFKKKIHEENLLKILYKKQQGEPFSFPQAYSLYSISKFQLYRTIRSLKKSGLLQKEKHQFFLTENGKKKLKIFCGSTGYGRSI